MSGPSHLVLERLIRQRLEPGADREAIDRSIRSRFEETWTIAFSDLVGFSRRTKEFGIIHFLSVIHRKEQLLRPVVESHGGLILKQEADSWLMLFRDPVQALTAMVDCQRASERFNLGVSEEDQVQLCVGIGHGSVLKIGDDDVWGEEVNLASKLGEDVARRGEILVTAAAAEAATRQGLDGVVFDADVSRVGSLQLEFLRARYAL